MGRIISVANQKGGVGKTTTSINLAAALTLYNKRVLIIDIDAQGNATSGLGINKAKVNNDIYDVLINDVPMTDAVWKTSNSNLDIIPASIQLAGAEVELTTVEQRERVLRDHLNGISDNYDFVLIDCPPSLGELAINAFTASDSILIPVQSEYYALEGLTQLLNTIQLVQKHFNTDLEIEGVLLTMYDVRTKLGAQVIEEVKKYFDDMVYQTIIPRTISLAEAPSHGMSILDYNPTSKGAKVYINLAKEVMSSNGQTK